MRLKSSLRPIVVFVAGLPAAGREVGIALHRQALDQQAGGALVVGRQHQARVELLGLQHVVLEHLRQLLQRLALVAVQRHDALVGLLARRRSPGSSVIAQRPWPCTLSMASSCAPVGTSPTTLAVARKPRSGCASATASLTGPSPNTCRISAPSNLMLACIRHAGRAHLAQQAAHLGDRTRGRRRSPWRGATAVRASRCAAARACRAPAGPRTGTCADDRSRIKANNSRRYHRRHGSAAPCAPVVVAARTARQSARGARLGRRRSHPMH